MLTLKHPNNYITENWQQPWSSFHKPCKPPTLLHHYKAHSTWGALQNPQACSFAMAAELLSSDTMTNVLGAAPGPNNTETDTPSNLSSLRVYILTGEDNIKAR